MQLWERRVLLSFTVLPLFLVTPYRAVFWTGFDLGYTLAGLITGNILISITQTTSQLQPFRQLFQELRSAFNTTSICEWRNHKPDELEHCSPFPWRLRTDQDQVLCWPSEGSFWATTLTPTQMNDLGLPRFQNSSKAESQGVEDMFCNGLKLLGSKMTYYPTPDSYIMQKYNQVNYIGNNTEFRFVLLPEVAVCWPDGRGVWSIEGQKLNQDMSSILSRTLSMGERCRLIQDNGGRYYAEFRDCPEVEERLPC